MINFIGLGLNPPLTIPCEGVNLSKECSIKYLDIYTTKLDPATVKTLEYMLGAQTADRTILEDANKIINLAKEKNVCIYVYGDPFIATTHQALKIEALKRSIPVRSIYASSFINALLGETGLHIYKIGFIGTLLMDDLSSAQYIYRNVKRSLEMGKHSILIVYSNSSDTTLKDALNLLIRTENNYRESVFALDTGLIVAGDLGKENQEILAGKLGDLVVKEYSHKTFAIIVPTELHFTEEESLKFISSGKPIGNSVKTLLRQRTEKIINITSNAIDDITPNKQISTLVENARLYLKDANQCLNKGEEETALMQAAYAEGLIDALRFLGITDIKW